MSKAKTAKKSKPAKKAVHKTFHRQSGKKPITPNLEPAPPTSPIVNQTVTPPEIKPEAQLAPTNSQPQQAEEITAPSTPETTSAATQDTSQINTENKTEQTPDEKLTPASEGLQNPAQPAEFLLSDENDGNSKKPLIIAIVIIILITASISVYYLYTKKFKTAGEKPQPTPTAQISRQSPEPSKTLNKADWTLEILNGSDKKGAAATLAEKLTAKGYQIIQIGNAAEDVNTSQVFFADSTQDMADLFLEDIKDELPNPTNAGALKDSTASARIIIGAE